MKSGTHPEYYAVEATCVCGNVIATGSTNKVVKMDICSACHPFFTGTQKIVDTEGRVEKFKKRYTQAEAQRKDAKKGKAEPEAAAEPSVAESSATDSATDEAVATEG